MNKRVIQISKVSFISKLKSETNTTQAELIENHKVYYCGSALVNDSTSEAWVCTKLKRSLANGGMLIAKYIYVGDEWVYVETK